MSTIYWIMVVGNVCVAVAIIFILSLVATFLLTKEYMTRRDDDCFVQDGTYKIIAKACKVSYITLAVSMILCIFLPSKKDLYMIYGVGGTLDYLKQNPTASKLPDKFIKAIDKWADSLVEDKEKNNKEEE